ncbi:MAG: nuclear transport factor 2 family protein [Dehalococcoidia bacterium]
MNIEEAQRIAKRHEDVYNHDFEHYADLYDESFVGYRPGRGTTGGREEMIQLERRATAACPDRRTTVLRAFAGEGNCLTVEEIWEGTNTGGDRLFGEPGAKVSIYAMSLFEVRDGKFLGQAADSAQPRSAGTPRQPHAGGAVAGGS